MVPDPLLAPVVAVMAGVVSARYVAFGTGELAAAAAALAALGAVRGRTRKPALLAALVFAGALLGVAHRPGPSPALDATPDELVILGGCIVEPPAFTEGREQFVLEIEPGARVRVSVHGDALPSLRYGQRVELDGTVRHVHNFGNPGAFDYERYLARRDIYWTASGRAETVKVLAGECGSAFRKAIFGVRGAALARIEKLYAGRRWHTAMMKGLLVGHAPEMERAWIEDFRRTGTYHALVISGLHVTIIVGIFLFLFRLLPCPSWLALTLTSATAWLYALVCGGDAPVVRAAAGCTLFAVGRHFYRRARLLNLLAAVALVFLALDPEQLFDASFQLSFLSVAVLGALAVPLLERTSQPYSRALKRLDNREVDLHLEPQQAHFRLELRLLAETMEALSRFPRRLCLAVLNAALRAALFVYDLAAVSAVMQFGLALPMAVYFHRLSVTGVTANVVIVPLTSVAVPLGFGAVLTGSSWLAAGAARLLEISGAVAAWHAGWETSWRVPDPPLWLGAAFAAAVLLFALTKRPALFAAAAALLAVLVWHPFAPRVTPGTLELTAIDVGQGESLFLALPDGKLMLVDTGGIAPYGRGRKPLLDIGEDVVSPYLWSRSVRRLDAVAITHGHEDHSGGLEAVVANFRPRDIWRPGRFKAGDRFDFGGARFEVLSGSSSVPPHNNDSLVLRIAYGRHSFLLTGDMERQVEAELIRKGAPLRADVLKVAHHGSRTSTTVPFLELARPAVAVISAGFENRFHNPHAEVIARLDASGARVLRTDLWGLVSVRSDGRRLKIGNFRWRLTE